MHGSTGTGTDGVVNGLLQALDGDILSLDLVRNPNHYIDPLALKKLDAIRPGGARDIERIRAGEPFAPAAKRNGGHTPVDVANRFALIPAAAMEDLPKPEWLIDNKLTKSGLSVLAGPPGCGKTFMALSDACSIADEDAPVIYVAAEGSAGIGARLRAWKLANHAGGARLDVYFVTEPVALGNAAEVGRFIAALEPLGPMPAMVVIDTLARCMIDGDENSTKDMSAFIAGADTIRRVTGAHVQLLHHFNAGGERERGNTALRGACDTMMFLKAEGGELTLSCEKQKDAPPFQKQAFRLAQFGESAAVISAKDGLHLRGSVQDPIFTESHLEVLRLVQSHFTEKHGPTTSEWLQATGWPESKRRTFFNYRTLFVQYGYVNEPERERGGRYTLTDKGRAALSATVQDE